MSPARQKPFTRSGTTDAIVRYLQPHDKGTQLSYAELSRAVGVEITSTSGKLQSAIHILQASHAQVWARVPPHVGIKRLNDSEMAARLASLHMNGARRKLKRGDDLADQVDTRQLDVSEQVKFSVDSIQRELALQSLSKAARRHLEQVARGNSNELPRFNIVEWAISLSKKT